MAHASLPLPGNVRLASVATRRVLFALNEAEREAFFPDGVASLADAEMRWTPDNARTAEAWTAHVAEVAERTLFPKATSSWYLGSNIDGKKRVFMPYIGGFGNYRKSLDDVAAQGYPGLVLTSR